jgi:uncharacterized protein
MNEKSFPLRRPYLFTFLMELLIIAVYLISGTAATLLKLGNSALYFYANLALTVLGILLLSGLRWWKRAGFVRAQGRGQLSIFWLAFIPPVVNLVIGGIHLPNLQVGLTFLVLALMVGFSEEVFFRGLIMRAILPHGAWKAAIISSLLFGLTHSLNVLSGSNSFYTLLQIGYALAIGFCFAAMAIRTGLIWPLVLAHFLTDLFGFWAGGLGSAGVTSAEIIIAAVYVVVFTAYGLWLMLKRPAVTLAGEGAF